MKKRLLLAAAIMMAALFALAGCDLFPFMAEPEPGERFEADGLEQVLTAVAARNYTLDENETNQWYIMENAVVNVWRSGSGSKERTYYFCYDTTRITITADGNSVVEGVMKYVHKGGGGGYGPTKLGAESIQDFYDSFGEAKIVSYDWEYDETEKLYRHGWDTLQIDGTRVNVKLGQDSFTMRAFGATQFDLSYFDDARQ